MHIQETPDTYNEIVTIGNTLINKISNLAQVYTPEWAFSSKPSDASCDVGSVVALLYKDMMAKSTQRLQSVLDDRHKIQFLNLVQQNLKDEQLETAEGHVQFSLVTGAPKAVYIKRKTQVFAKNDDTGQPIIFETHDAISATPAKLTSIYMTSGKDDWIGRIYSDSEINSTNNKTISTENISFQAFSNEPFLGNPEKNINLNRHSVVIGFVDAFDNISKLNIELTFEGASTETMSILSGSTMEFKILGEHERKTDFHKFDSVEIVEDKPYTLRLKSNIIQPQKAILKDVECYQIQITLKTKQNITVPRLEIRGIKVKSSANKVKPKEIHCNGVSQDIEEEFYPFGHPMEMHATCEFECPELFARKNANATINFEYGYDEFIREITGYEAEVFYGVLRKAGLEEKKPTETLVKAERVLFEYLSKTGWKNVTIKDSREFVSTIFTRYDDQGKGKAEINFIVPDDILDTTHALGQSRMRIRLLRANGLYQMPSRIYCPKMQNINFSYSYDDENALKPKLIVTYNDLIETIHTGDRGLTLFTTRLEDEPAIYLGFDRNPWEGSNNPRISLYLRMENDTDKPIGFTIGCVYKQTNENDFKCFERNDSFADYTNKMRDPGTLLLGVNQKRNVQDLVPIALFGEELYWVRILKKPSKREDTQFIPPRITGIFLNMVRVKNLWTQTQEFDLNVTDGILKTRGRNLISVVLEVNEEDGKDGNNWVRWKASLGTQLREERVYSIVDPSAGLIRITKTALARYPVKSKTNNVRVTYETYRGELANVDSGEIDTLASSIAYVSGVTNPFATRGGYDATDENTINTITNAIRTRNRAVTKQDYEQLIKQVSQSIKSVKVVNDKNDMLTIAVLTDGYEKGDHLFSKVRRRIERMLKEYSAAYLIYKDVDIRQPRFVPMSINLRFNISENQIDDLYETENECKKILRNFLDPINGGSGGNGWTIGVLPTSTQILAYFQAKLSVAKIANVRVTAMFDGEEHIVNERPPTMLKDNDLMLAISGEHIVDITVIENN